MDKIIALSAYACQAGSAAALTIGLGVFLPAAEYARYSLTLATAQVLALATFEWVRLAATRYYPCVTDEETHAHKSTLILSGVGASIVTLVSAAVFFAFGWSISLAILLPFLIVGQSLTDIQMVFARFRGDMRAFACLQVIRASAMLVMGLLAAHYTNSAEAVLGALSGAYLITSLAALKIDPDFWNISKKAYSIKYALVHARYGYSVSSASLMHQASTLILRYAIGWVATPAISAQVYLALDLMQRPFAVLMTALAGVFFPDVAAAYRQNIDAHRAIRRYRIRMTMVVFGLAVFIMSAIAVAAVFKAFSEHPVLLLSLFAATLIFALRALLQTILAVEAHLAARIFPILAIGLADVLWASGLIVGAFYAFKTMEVVLLSAVVATAAACVSVLVGQRILFPPDR